jgi:uncharacterized protein
MLAGFGVALPIDVALEVSGAGGSGLLLARYGAAPIVALAILAVVAEFYARRTSHQLGIPGRRLTEVGRMALSCYVFQNLVASALCYGWGLGLAAMVPAEQRVPATVAIYLVLAAITMTFAHLWLRRFDRGPVEWLWNSTCQAITRPRTNRDTVAAA